MGFSERLKELRTEKNYTQKELATMLSLSPNCICEWEKGRSEPSIDTLKKISSIFECSIDFLTGNTDELGVLPINPSFFSDENTTEEKELLKDFRSLPRQEKAQATAYVHYLAEKRGDTSKRA